MQLPVFVCLRSVGEVGPSDKPSFDVRDKLRSLLLLARSPVGVRPKVALTPKLKRAMLQNRTSASSGLVQDRERDEIPFSSSFFGQTAICGD